MLGTTNIAWKALALFAIAARFGCYWHIYTNRKTNASKCALFYQDT